MTVAEVLTQVCDLFLAGLVRNTGCLNGFGRCLFLLTLPHFYKIERMEHVSSFCVLYMFPNIFKDSAAILVATRSFLFVKYKYSSYAYS